jgi:hypothetical protein
MTKILIGMLSLALVGVGGLVAAVDGFGDDQSVRSVSIPADTTTAGTTSGAGTTTSAEDVSGPCDEPEHATDPRCRGNGTAITTTGTTTGAEDVSGPCDEPEHATDPRCTGDGTTTDGGEDRSGSGHNDNDEDRSGSNSGTS